MIILPGYIIHEKIDENNKLKVYRGHTVPDRKPVIIRTLKTAAVHPAHIPKLMHEYESTRGLNIPEMVKPLQLVRTGPYLALILEDTGAVSLRVYLRQHHPDLPAFFSLAFQLVETLGKLRQKGVIHRDLRPEHILIHPETGKIEIIDCSTAPFFFEESENTPIYKFPEQMGQVKRMVDFQGDFYRLGMVFYEIIKVTDSAQGTLRDFLTEREGEVAELIAAGLSNKEIAERLKMTINTVKTHIKNIYGKLGINNRVQVAAKVKEMRRTG